MREMARMTEEERLQKLQEKMDKLKVEKQKLESRVKEKERKERTRRLIKIGALIEKHFDVRGEEEAIKLIASFQEPVMKNKEKINQLDINVARKKLGIELDKKNSL